jgi:hypothetical protein
VLESVRMSGAAEKMDKANAPRGGGDQSDLGERSTLFAQRIWEAFARHKWTTSKVALPAWSALDEGRRRDLTALSAEALSSGETR